MRFCLFSYPFLAMILGFGSVSVEKAWSGTCPEFNGEVVGTTPAALNETSGIVTSRTHEGLFYMHNDTDSGARIYVTDISGNLLKTLVFNQFSDEDLEDIAIDQNYIYLGAIGNNTHTGVRSDILKFEEPSLSEILSGGTHYFTPDEYDVISFMFEDSFAYTTESLSIDEVTGDLVITTKGTSDVYIVSHPYLPGSLNIANYVGTIGSPLGQFQATGSEISSNGRFVLTTTYQHALVHYRAPGTSIAQAIQTEPCVLPVDPSSITEAIGFHYGANGNPNGYITVPEGHFADITLFSLE